VLSVAPSFSLYALQARLLGAELREVPLGPAFALPLEALLRELAEGEGVHFLAAPMAPTGNAVSRGDVRTLARAGASALADVIDEAYGPFAGSDFSAVVRDVPGAVSLRTCSKAFGMGGVRLGYALADPAVAVHLRKAVLPFTVSALQAALVETVLEDPTFVRSASSADRGRARAARRRAAALPGIEVFPSVTNFLLVRVADAAAVHAGLLARGIVVRRQDHLPGLRRLPARERRDDRGERRARRRARRVAARTGRPTGPRREDRGEPCLSTAPPACTAPPTRPTCASNSTSTAGRRAATGHGFIDHLLEQLIRHGRSGSRCGPAATCTSTSTTSPRTSASPSGRRCAPRWATRTGSNATPT
jgi:hypothetical protein